MPPPRTILITGAATGLGRALAEALAAEQTLLLLHHQQSSPQAVLQAVRARGAKAIALQADLACPAQREALLARCQEATPRLHLLINNAAAYAEAPLEHISPAAFSRTLELNCAAVQHLIHAARPLLEAAAPAQVINLGDAGADRIQARPQATAYHIAKLGVHVLTRSYARLLGPAGIRVNMISPGFLENSTGQPGSPPPLGRLGRFADISAAVHFLCSPQAEYISGANLVISGAWNR